MGDKWEGRIGRVHGANYLVNMLMCACVCLWVYVCVCVCLWVYVCVRVCD